jgi:hypothetical protein
MSVAFFVLDGEDVNFGECCCIILVFFALGNDVDEALSSWKMGVSL